MRRRDFIAGIAVSTAMPLALRAQQSGKMRLIGALMGQAENGVSRSWFAAFQDALTKLGWT
jgi:hypothetical protein